MKAEELRIGNLVLRATGWDKNGVPFFSDNLYMVDNISSFSIGIHDFPEFQGCNEIPIKDLEPILLTEDWLIKFGFEIKENVLIKEGFRIFRGYWDSIDLNQGSEYSGVAIQKIKTVHELQNIYYILTGKELELKQ